MPFYSLGNELFLIAKLKQSLYPVNSYFKRRKYIHIISLLSHSVGTIMRKGEEEIAIANPLRTLGRIPLGIAGGINAARQFARFIQLYMEEEEVRNIPEFEKYKNNDKQEADQDRMEDINTW